MPDHDHTLDDFDHLLRDIRTAKELAAKLAPSDLSVESRREAIERIGFVTDQLEREEMVALAFYISGRFPAATAMALAEQHPQLVRRVVDSWHPIGDASCDPKTCVYCFEPEDNPLEMRDEPDEPDLALVVEVDRHRNPYEDNGSAR